MFSPALHSLMVQAHIDDRCRSAQTNNRSHAIAQTRETRAPHAARLTAYVRRAVARVHVRYAWEPSEALAANHVFGS